MNARDILRIATYVTAGLIFAVGILILTGYLVPVYVQTKFRIIVGLMMILYAIYRVITVTRKKRREYEIEE